MAFSTAYGASPDKFGHDDYNAALSTGASKNEILNWLSGNTGLLGGNNAPGKGGLFDEISKAAEEERRAQAAAIQSVGLSTAYGQSDSRFGHEDYYQALRDNVSPTTILKALDQNKDLLAPNNQRGAGGLYNEIQSAALKEQQDARDAAAANAAWQKQADFLREQAAAQQAASKAMLDSMNAQTEALLGQAKASNDAVAKQMADLQEKMKNRITPTTTASSAKTSRLRGIFNPLSSYDQQKRAGGLRGRFNAVNFYDRERLGQDEGGLFESILNESDSTSPASDDPLIQLDDPYITNPVAKEEESKNPFDDPNFGFSDPWAGVSVG